jgi:DNA modification methylase
MVNRLADVVITDPPYNVPISGHVSTGTRHEEFLMASGEMSAQEFHRFLSRTCLNLSRVSRSGSLHFIFMDWRSIDALLSAGAEVYDSLVNIIVWVKRNGGMGSLYRSRHELVALFKSGKRPHKNNVQLGANGRYRTNVWEFPGANDGGSQIGPDGDPHPTIKNLEMITEAIRDVTDPNDIVLDAFGGSGTTLIAAARCGRVCRMLELDPHYCDLIVERALAEGLDARLAGPGFSFAQARTARQSLEEPAERNGS